MFEHPETALITRSGATTTPLTTAAQIYVGALLTGAEAEFIWQVTDVVEDVMILQKTDAAQIPCRPTAHRWQDRGSAAPPNQECLVCGMRKQYIAGPTGILPLPPATGQTGDPQPRALILRPEGALRVPAPLTLYLTHSGQVIQMIDRRWRLAGTAADREHKIPVVPKLQQVWELPPRLHDLVLAATVAATLPR